jgi:microcystin-dependent protein
LICDGAARGRNAFAALFGVIGTAYGVGNGSTTFNIPDLRGRMPRGVDGSFALGVSGGADSFTLVANQLPEHSHTLWRGGAQANQGSTNSDWIGTPNVDTGFATGGTLYTAASVPGGTRTALGTQQAVVFRPQFQAMNYIIKT